MTEEVGVQMVRLQEQLKSVVSGLEADREERRVRDHQIEIIMQSTNNLDRRLEMVERQLAENTPSIKEFMVMKHQIEGAGVFGRWIWLGAGALIGFIASSKEMIAAWLKF